MKYKLTFITAFISFVIFGKAQTNDTSKVDYNNKVFTSTQIEAHFPGGPTAWKFFLEKNLNSSVPAKKGAPAGRYTVTVNFIVDEEGTISDIQVANNPGYGTAEEAIRVIKNGPKWDPALLNGNVVKYRVNQSIAFVVSYETSFTGVQIAAEFQGGLEALRSYIERNLNANIASEKGAPSGKYRVMLYFLVDSDGKVNDVIAENNPGYGTTEEAIRVMKNSPKWIPARQNGQNVASRMRHPITFLVSGDK